MTPFLIILLSYVLISSALFFAMKIRCAKNAVFAAPERSTVFYILSLTWGLPKVLVGALAALALRISGHKPSRYGPVWCFEIGGIDWGAELGLFFIAPKDGGERIKAHELGHAVQNVYFGIFTPLVISLPSFMRFWYRRIRKNTGHPCASEYDGIWFERSATESGIEYMKQY